MDRMYRNGAISGAVCTAILIGVIIGGDHSPILTVAAIASALFTGGQIWARRRGYAPK